MFFIFQYLFIRKLINLVFMLFIIHLAAPRVILGHWQGVSLTYPMLITTLMRIRPPNITRWFVAWSDPQARASTQWVFRNLPILNAIPQPTMLLFPSVENLIQVKSAIGKVPITVGQYVHIGQLNIWKKH